MVLPPPPQPRYTGRCRMNTPRSLARLFAVSFLTLFLEVLLIRWAPGQLRILAYYTNFILLAAFLGLGYGLTRPDGPRSVFRWLGKLVTVLFLLMAARRLHLAGTEQDMAVYAIWAEAVKLPVPVYIYLPAFFFLFASIFVEPGRWTASFFAQLNPLPAYAANLAGGLAGLLGFTALGHLEAQPWIWWLAAMLALGLMAEPSWVRSRLALAALSLAIVALVAWNDRGDHWSPYYKIRTTPLHYVKSSGELYPGFLPKVPGLSTFDAAEGVNIEVNDDYITFILGLEDETLARHPFLTTIREQYQQPFRYAAALDDVLVLGSGGGTDLAEAQRLGVRNITAVEIDPYIAHLGQTLHPEDPYGKPNVRLVIDDARHYLNSPVEKKFDLILFSYLDSHRLTSAHAGVRLEGFLYSANAFSAAMKRLKPGGVIVVRHVFAGAMMPFMHQKFVGMLAQAAGEDHVRVNVRQGDYIAAGDQAALARLQSMPGLESPVFDATVDVPDDDWPFLYLAQRGIPTDYLAVLAVITGFLVIAFRRHQRDGRPSLPVRERALFATLGAAFLLLEAQTVTGWALLFGSTWQVSAIVFATILTLAFLANLLVWKVGRLAADWRFIATGLGMAVAANLFISPTHFAGGSLVMRLMIGGAVGLSPVFFSGLLFSRMMARTASAASALGWNLFGAMAGGFAEYSVMWTGLPALRWAVAVLYLVALWLARNPARQP